MQDRSGSPETPTKKGKDRQTDTEDEESTLVFSLIQKQVLESVKASRLANKTQIMEATIETDEGDFSSESVITMALLIEQANQIRTLTAMVQNLATSVQELKGAVAEKRPEKKKTSEPVEKKEKTYAEAANTQSAKADPETPGGKGGKKKNKGKRKAEEGPTPSKAPPAKKTLKEGEKEAEPESKEWTKVNKKRPKKEQDVTKRKLFATRTTSKPFKNPAVDEARISVAIARTLLGCKCEEPTSLQVSSNRFNGTVTLTVPNGSVSGQYTKYLGEITKALNGALPDDEPEFLPFRQVPTDVDVLIHGITLAAVPEDPIELNNNIKEYFKDFHRIDVSSAKFLKANPESRIDKRATSIVVRLPEVDTAKVTPHVVFMGKRKESRVMWHATPTTQCTRCWKFGHPKIGCRENTDLCPICSKTHAEKDHKCHQPNCEGYRRIKANCCQLTPAKCPTCGGAHSAKDKICPVRIQVKEQEKAKYDQRMASLAETGMTDTNQ